MMRARNMLAAWGLALTAPCAAALDLAPLRAAFPDGLRFDAVHTCHLPRTPEMHILTSRTWIAGGALQFAIGSIDPGWSAHSFPLYPLGVGMAIEPDRFSGTLWGVKALEPFDGPAIQPLYGPASGDSTGTGEYLRGLLGEVLGAGIPFGALDIVGRPLPQGIDVWRTGTAGHTVDFAVEDNRLSTLVVRPIDGGGDAQRRFSFHYDALETSRLASIRFEYAAAPPAPISEDAQIASDNRDSERCVPVLRGEMRFAPVALGGDRVNLPSEIEVRLAATGATLYTTRLFGFQRIPAGTPREAIEAEVEAYGYGARWLQRMSPIRSPRYLEPAATLSAEDRAAMVAAAEECLAHADASGSPADRVFANHAALYMAVLTGDAETAAQRFAVYLDHMGGIAGLRALRECGVELLRYVLRRKDLALFDRLLPLFRARYEPTADLVATFNAASDYATRDNYWAAMEFCAAALALPGLDAQWRFRFEALEAWCAFELSNPSTDWFQYLQDWGQCPPALYATARDERVSAAAAKMQAVLASYAALPAPPDPFDSALHHQIARASRGELVASRGVGVVPDSP